ncbi:hypothetical protein OAD74_09010 [Alphaproteobacteria bacterium]|nr:hypothetical protein [Alphaproteobacteria bacterium]
MAEDKKSIAFVRLGESRVTKALYAISNVGKLSNRNNYSYTADQVRMIISELKSAVNDVENDFNKSPRKKSDFKFK